MLNKQMEKMAEAKGYPVEKQRDKQERALRKFNIENIERILTWCRKDQWKQ